MPGGFRLHKFLKIVDVVIEAADARLPASSRYPDLGKLFARRHRFLVLTRADLADPVHTRRWLDYFRQQGESVVAVNARTGEGMRELRQKLAGLRGQKVKELATRGFCNKPLRLMIVGIPNVGKSTLLNRLAGRAVVPTGDRPGITRGPQWVRVESGLELLDTPGVLWPYWSKHDTALNLAAIGCLPDTTFAVSEVALNLIDFLLKEIPGLLADRYAVNEDEKAEEILSAIGRRRGFFVKKGEIDFEKSAVALLEDFREGRLGRITLEAPGGGN
ncbi:MAG: ribosome biosis GTPase [Clostridia bacterium]|nr:ribosome biosis GTPase [Clostridia bacterium]